VWFTENPWPPIGILVLIGLIFLGVWNSNRRGLHLLLALGCFLACFGLYGLERLLETDAERLQKRVEQLCYDFRDKAPGVLDYFSDTQPELKQLVAEAQNLVTVHKDLRLSDFQRKMLGPDSGSIRFRANATLDVRDVGNVGYQPAMIELEFRREGDVWRVIRVRRFNPLNGREMDVLQRSAG